MNFLNPVLLPFLLLALLPIIIHLLNRLRYRSVKWAAMMFLISANKSSTRHARLRQYLILACRCCLLFFFLFALARPIIGGWLGMQLAGAPDTVLILLDRSASMEARDPRVQKSKREHAIDLFADAANKAGKGSRYVLIENVLHTPQEIGSPEALRDYLLASPTDTAADLPVMLRAARDYLVANPEGRSEIWIASDLQASNWRPESREWERLSAELAGLPQDVRIRLLALNDVYQENFGVNILLARRHVRGLDLAVALRKNARHTDPIPVVYTLNGARSQVEIKVDAADFRLNRKLEVPADQPGGGWGAVELAADENLRDNAAYFVYGDLQLARSSVIAEDGSAQRLLYLATAPDGKRREAVLLDPAGATAVDWAEQSFVVWQGKNPETSVSSALLRYVEQGGVVFCLPGTAQAASGPFDLAWGQVETAAEGEPFRVTEWEENDGPLARSQNGRNLPVDELEVFQRRLPADALEGWFPLATYADGHPFLLRKQFGRGWVYASTTLPVREWSTLANGTVVVPMVQRMIQQGASRMTQVASQSAGEWTPDETMQAPWLSLDAPGQKDPRWDAGVYESGGVKVALNRPVAEDDEAVVDRESLGSLFGPLKVQVMQEDAASHREALSSEIWRAFVFVALLFMITESVLVLSGIRRRAEVDHGFGSRSSNEAAA